MSVRIETRGAPLRQFLSRASGTGFAASVRIMLTGTVLGQAASLLLAPALTRLFPPEAFGYLGVYSSALTILGVIASLGYELAIPLARSDREFEGLVGVSAVALAVTTLVVALFALLLPDSALAAMRLQQLSDYRVLIPIGFACLGGYYMLVAAATQLGEFQAIASTRLSQGLSGPISQIVLGLAGAGAPGLAIGFVIGQSSGTLLLLKRVIERCPRSLRQRRRRLAAVAMRYAQFPLITSWSRLIDMAGSGPILYPILASCYGGDVAGYLFLAERVVMRPLLMISTSLLQVFIGEAGRAARNDPRLLMRRFKQVVGWQFVLSAGWIVAINIVAIWMFGTLFGARWQAAVPFLPACGLMYLALVVVHPVSTALQLLERHGAAACWQGIRLIAVIAGVLAAYHAGASALDTLWVAAITQAVACAGLVGLIAFYIKRIQLP
jgi:O-antigen/teichoic acid export membrane protein